LFAAAPLLALAQATSPFMTGATALQTNILAWLTPIAIILVMALGAMAMANRFKLIGTTGTGKSTAIAGLMHGALERGDRAVIADPDGGYLERFHRRRRGDVILNPFEPESVKWNPFAELAARWDADQLASGLIPGSDDPSGREWRGYAPCTRSVSAVVSGRGWCAARRCASRRLRYPGHDRRSRSTTTRSRWLRRPGASPRGWCWSMTLSPAAGRSWPPPRDCAAPTRTRMCARLRWSAPRAISAGSTACGLRARGSCIGRGAMHGVSRELTGGAALSTRTTACR
jgi:hypothetical protein